MTLLLKSSCDSWDGFPTGHHSLLRLHPPLWFLTPDFPVFLGWTLYCSGQFQSPGSGVEDTAPAPGIFGAVLEIRAWFQILPTLSPKRKMGRGFGIGVPNVPSLFPALYVEREERHSHVTKGNCTILPSALPLRKLNGVQSVWGLSWNFSSPFLNLFLRYLFLFLFYLKIGIRVRIENTVSLEVGMGLSTM